MPHLNRKSCRKQQKPPRNLSLTQTKSVASKVYKLTYLKIPINILRLFYDISFSTRVRSKADRGTTKYYCRKLILLFNVSRFWLVINWALDLREIPSLYYRLSEKGSKIIINCNYLDIDIFRPSWTFQVLSR